MRLLNIRIKAKHFSTKTPIVVVIGAYFDDSIEFLFFVFAAVAVSLICIVRFVSISDFEFYSSGFPFMIALFFDTKT